MKATLSKDDKYRTNLRVTYRLDKDQMVALLALHSSVYAEASGTLSEAEVLYRVKSHLMFSGTDALDFGSDTDVGEEANDWAKEQVERFWKEEK